jgi:hypothetical protein
MPGVPKDQQTFSTALLNVHSLERLNLRLGSGTERYSQSSMSALSLVLPMAIAIPPSAIGLIADVRLFHTNDWKWPVSTPIPRCRSPAKGLDFGLLCNLKCIINLYTEMPHCAFELGVPQR